MAASGLHTPSGDYLHLSELRIVLLGYRVAGKTSSGNTILGREEFDLRTAVQCVKRQGEVAGRQVTVVDTPGWWANNPLEKTHELLKQEIVLSVSLCPPGPHTFLLVIDVDDSFTEEYRRAVEEHLELLSEKVWSHTIVLFTHGDFLGDTTIDQHIERQGKALQWLVEKCGNRYHVFNNKNRGDGTQVTELLNNIEETVAGNRGGHYEIKRKILEKIEEKRKAEEERARQRLMKVHEQRKTLRSLIGDSLHLSELRIVLLGYRGGSGKSSAGNTILGREEFDLKTTAQCVKKQGEVAGRQVTVVDTPGWWKNLPVERTPELVKQEILLSVSLCPPGPHTFLLVISVGFLYSEEDRRAVEEHLTLLSETVWSHTIVLFTRGDCLGDTTVEQHIESEGEALQWLIEKCGNRYHILNNENRGDATQVTELLEKIEEMVAGNRGGHFEIKRELLEKIEVWRRKKEDKAKQLCMRVKKQREIHRTFIGDSLYLSELRIVLLGSRDAGKSSAGNTILGREEFDLRTAAQCVKRQGEVAGRQVTVVDTPGWWKNLPVEYTPELVKQEIVFSASLCPPGPHTLFLVIRVDVSFKEEETNAAEDHLELLSETVWSHTIVLFTHGDCLGDTTIEQHIQREGKALQWLVEKCGNRFHVLNNNNRGDVTQVTELLEKIDELVAANSGDVFYPERDCEEGMNWIPEEMWEKPSLPLKGAHSIYPPLLSMSGGSRPETGYDGSDQMSGFGSVAESLLRLVVPGDDISDTQSLRSSVYSSQTSEPVCEHNSGSKSSRAESSLDFMSLVVKRIFCSQKNPCTSGTSNPASQHSSTSTPEEHTLAVVTKLTPETSTEFTVTSCRLQCSHAGLFQCSLTGLVFLMEGEGEVLYRTVQWDENLLHSTGQTPAGPLFSIECPQGSICQLHLPHCEILSGEGLDSLSVAHVTGDSAEVLPPLRVTDTHVVVKITDLSLWGLVRMFRPFLSIKGQVLPFLQSFGHPQAVLNVIVLPSNVPLNEVKQQQTGNTYIPVCSDCTLSRGGKYSLSCDLKKIQDIYPKAKRVQIYWGYGPNYHPTFQVFLKPDAEHVELRLLERGADGEVWAGRVLLKGAVLVGRDQAENSHSDSAEKQLHSVRKNFVDRVSKSVVDDLLDGLLQQKVINNHEMETVKVIPERAEKAREVIDMVQRKGDVSCLIMKNLLVELDPFLCTTLGFR